LIININPLFRGFFYGQYSAMQEKVADLLLRAYIIYIKNHFFKKSQIKVE